jgi:hypothetical protein
MLSFKPSFQGPFAVIDKLAWPGKLRRVELSGIDNRTLRVTGGVIIADLNY